jgi:dihydroorotate dehydrogenase
MTMYRSIVRPLLFRFPPEATHRMAGTVLRLPLPWGLGNGRVRNPRLEVSVGPLRFRNPIGMAAGFDKNCRFLGSFDKMGFGYAVGGTVTAEARRGNPKPRIARFPKRESLINAMGFPNDGAEAAARALGQTRAEIPILVSISDAEVQDALRSFRILEPVCDGIELNLSCPNVSWGRDAHVEDLLVSFLENRGDSQKPIFVKIPPYRGTKEREAVFALVRLAQEHGATAITATNTLPVATSSMATGRGGLSGRAITEDTIRIVRDLYQLTGGVMPINACGGIFTAEDAIACVRAGATTVQIYSGLVYEGPRIVRTIATGIAEAVPVNGGGVEALRGTAA